MLNSQEPPPYLPAPATTLEPPLSEKQEENQLSWRRGTSRDDQEAGSYRMYTNQHRRFQLSENICTLLIGENMYPLAGASF